MINMTIGTRGFEEKLDVLAKQVPFAASRALNDAVNAGQTAIRKSLPERFTIRSARALKFLERTIYRQRGVDFATKRQLTATVRVDPRRPILARHEKGGRFLPSGPNPWAIPGRYLRIGGGPIARKFYPVNLGILARRRISGGFEGGKLKGKYKTFGIGTIFGHKTDGWSAIYQRVGKKRGDIRLWWNLFPGPISLTPRLQFRKTAEEAVRREFPIAFRKRFAEAVRTAR